MFFNYSLLHSRPWIESQTHFKGYLQSNSRRKGISYCYKVERETQGETLWFSNMNLKFLPHKLCKKKKKKKANSLELVVMSPQCSKSHSLSSSSATEPPEEGNGTHTDLILTFPWASLLRWERDNPPLAALSVARARACAARRCGSGMRRVTADHCGAAKMCVHMVCV